MLRSFRLVALAAVLAGFAATPALAGGDAAAGEKAFAKCKVCHTLEAGKNKIGPTLHGLFGRKAGTVEGFAYSDAMKNSGIVWDEDTLKKYLPDPKAMVPGTKMAFAGIKKEDELENLIAYLEQATQ